MHCASWEYPFRQDVEKRAMAGAQRGFVAALSWRWEEARSDYLQVPALPLGKLNQGSTKQIKGCGNVSKYLLETHKQWSFCCAKP